MSDAGGWTRTNSTRGRGSAQGEGDDPSRHHLNQNDFLHALSLTGNPARKINKCNTRRCTSCGSFGGSSPLMRPCTTWYQPSRRGVGELVCGRRWVRAAQRSEGWGRGGPALHTLGFEKRGGCLATHTHTHGIVTSPPLHNRLTNPSRPLPRLLCLSWPFRSSLHRRRSCRRCTGPTSTWTRCRRDGLVDRCWCSAHLGKKVGAIGFGGGGGCTCIPLGRAWKVGNWDESPTRKGRREAFGERDLWRSVSAAVGLTARKAGASVFRLPSF